MDENIYLKIILDKWTNSINKNSLKYELGYIISLIERWAGNNLQGIYLSGSLAKGTSISGSSDVDFLISLSHQTQASLKEIYESLCHCLFKSELRPRRQNVSLGIEYSGYNIDLVPAKKQLGNTNYHSLFNNKTNTWLQTNIQKHIDFVIESGRVNEIKLIKIWAKNHNLDFPSILIEHIVIEALRNKRKNDFNLAENINTVFRYIVNEIETTRIVDISNTNNIISDDINIFEKRKISQEAFMSLNKAYWENIIW